LDEYEEAGDGRRHYPKATGARCWLLFERATTVKERARIGVMRAWAAAAAMILLVAGWWWLGEAGEAGR
jgi:hypothetical protein